MSLRKNTPCDLDGICPYESGEYCSCEYWCGADEPQDNPEDWEEFSPIDIFPDEDETWDEVQRSEQLLP